MKRIILSFIDVILLFTVVVIALLALAPGGTGRKPGDTESKHRYLMLSLTYPGPAKVSQEGVAAAHGALYLDLLSACDEPVWRLVVPGPALETTPKAVGKSVAGTPAPGQPAPEKPTIQLRSGTGPAPVIKLTTETGPATPRAAPVIFDESWLKVTLESAAPNR